MPGKESFHNMNSEKQNSIVIIGAGVGGITLAARLSKLGYKVSVYEKNDFGGGRCSLIEENGFRFDQGPSLLLMPEIFEETFEDLGENLHERLEILKCNPNYKLHFENSGSIELSSDLPILLNEVQKFEGKSPGTRLNLVNFIKETQIHYENSIQFALKGSFSNFWDLCKPKYVSLLWKLHLYDTVYNRVCKYFKTPEMRKAFSFQTMYLGMSPFDAPAPYSLLQFAEIGGGIWYPKGGFNKVFQELESIAKNHGAEFHYDQAVARINVQGDMVKGVELETGENVDADIVVCNADLVYAYNKLLPKTNYGKSLGENSTFTSSSISFYWGTSKSIPELTTHNIFLAKAFKESFDQIFIQKSLPDDPSFYVNVPSRIDPSAAPEGKDSIVVLVPVGHLEEHVQDIPHFVKKARKIVISTLEHRLGIKDFESLIETEIINDPYTWESKFNLWRGSILGLNHCLSQVLCFRPRNKSETFKNLYFVGASSQPGTGVPVVLCGAQTLAMQIHETIVSNNRISKSKILWLISTIVGICLVIIVLLIYAY